MGCYKTNFQNVTVIGRLGSLSQVITNSMYNCENIYSNMYGVELLLRRKWQPYDDSLRV